ncbi:MaoC family dehydratase N-terminal domain-containing protein [Microbacterium sp. zg.Y909]|uniref:MaoC family dehydratase N-terminal domain-containing protein n=1 Tax=Microbacterium sp. zg.Y909 TaxID=2969413 RepID=UPI00214C3C1C|nr:MaoC family dehydratase N-terminal domain-containing protein [Microbacterium sp. zg.Y909]MCR2824155.1 MaoC family dehydratase N-terminal domain-containing protein [Microbacterium sp. zg.Y909]
MADLNAVGTAGETYVLDVERGKIREFARATRSSNPAYLEPEAPVCPPTFLTVTNLWQPPAGNPWDATKLDGRRVLHAEQQYEFFGPPPTAGTRLWCTSRIADMYVKEGRRGGELTFVVMITDFLDEEGVLVARSTMTGVETARAAKEES